MSKYIKILPEHVISKIAAGEVIQRPESVVKELIENSIDAASKEITLIIKDAGKSLIQVIDDGTGMTLEDAEICFIRHSTSKISDERDLDSIQTLGFRGEALYSMAAIAQIEIRTKTENDELATLIKIENSSISEKSNSSSNRGTSIAVKNLFYNTPARRNFLKSDATEIKHIFDTFFKFCIGYPEIKFVFINNEDKVYEYGSTNYDSRIKQVFKEAAFNDLIHFSEDLDFIKISGYINKPQFLKKNRGDQHLFLNRRFITNKSINHAISSAFENFAKVQGYPFYIIFITIDPTKIDVNVHPTKLEVKFYDDRNIHNVVNTVIKKALGSANLTPDFQFKDNPSDFSNKRFESVSTEPNSSLPKTQQQFKEFRFTGIDSSSGRKNRLFNLDEYSSLFKSPGSENLTKDKEEEPILAQEFDHEEPGEIVKSEKGIWQIYHKYIITQIKSGIIIIDQHVAHERILYEKALTSLNNKLPFSQQLLFPKTIELSPADFHLLKELLDDLINLGFVIKLFSKNTFVLEGIPADVKFGNEENILKDIINDYRNNKEPNLEKKDNLAKTFACKSAIKFGDSLTTGEMISLIDQLFATSMPYVCPHGRPIIIRITIDELDKRFGRK